MAPMYYRGAAAAIVVYDVTSKQSFAGAKSWIEELNRRGDPGCVIALAGNKADLKRKVDAAEVEAFAAAKGLLHVETSAKTAEGIKELFMTIAEKLPKNAKPSLAESKQAFNPSAAKEKKSGCC